MNTQINSWQAKTAETPSDSGLMQKLPNLLRILGAAALVIAMYSFLAKGWQNGDDLLRYLLMLGHTAALAAVGLASGHWLKEGKGARLLLTLALIAVPANFAILGAFIFSQTAAVDMSLYPHYAAWHVDSLQTALITSAGAIAVLVPIVMLGFTVLARSMSKKLSALFFVSNAALLLPLRDPQLIGLLVLALAACAMLFGGRTARNHSAAKTSEGVTALGLQLLPLGVLFGRNLWLYSIDLFLLSVSSVALFLIMRQISLYLAQGSKPHNVMNFLSLIPAAFAALPTTVVLIDTRLSPALALPLAALLSAIMVYDIGQRSRNNWLFYRHIAVGGLLLCLIANLLLFADLAASLACVAIGMLLLIRAFQAQQRSLFNGGVVLMLAGTLQQFYRLVQHFDLGSWASLAVMGIAAIVIASVMESRDGMFRPKLERWKETFQGWER